MPTASEAPALSLMLVSVTEIAHPSADLWIGPACPHCRKHSDGLHGLVQRWTAAAAHPPQLPKAPTMLHSQRLDSASHNVAPNRRTALAASFLE